MCIEGIGVFGFRKDAKLKENEKKGMLQHSGVGICINSIRMLLLSLTANGPLNQYTVPSVDLSDLFEQKRAQVAEKGKTF